MLPVTLVAPENGAFFMSDNHALFMVLLGGKPKGRHIEQHDVYFGIETSIQALKPQLNAFWPEGHPLHLDGWRKVTRVGNFQISIIPATASRLSKPLQLFFINLGGYKPGILEEFHYKMVVVAADKLEAARQAKQSAFYQHTGFGEAVAHIDDRYGVDVDDLCNIEEILPDSIREKWQLQISPITDSSVPEDALWLGYQPVAEL